MPSLNSLAIFLNRYFATENYPDDTNGVYQPSERAVKRLGLALEPSPELYPWAEANGLDAFSYTDPGTSTQACSQAWACWPITCPSTTH